MVNTSDNQKNKNIVLLMIVILSVVSIFLLGLIFYLISSSKIVLLQSVTHLTNNTKEVIVESNNNYIEKMMENQQIEKIINEYNLNFSYISLLEDIEIKDYEKVTDTFYLFLKKEIDKNEISSDKKKITLNDKDKKVTKLSYRVTKNKLNSILSSTIDEILSDNKLLDSLSDVYGDNFKSSLVSYKNDLNNASYDYFNYNIYYYGFNNIVLYEIENSDYCVQLYNHDSEERIIVLENDRVIYTLNIRG